MIDKCLVTHLLGLPINCRLNMRKKSPTNIMKIKTLFYNRLLMECPGGTPDDDSEHPLL